MPKYIDVESATYDYGTLYDWFISSVGPEPPVWTDEHIEELEDFYVVPKSAPTADVVVLPCKTGDTVYYLTGNPTLSSGYHFNRVENTKCVGFYWDDKGLQICLYSPHGNHGTYGYFGKTVFLTQAEAEFALKMYK